MLEQIDKTNRLTSAVAVTVVQNVCVAVCAGCFLALFYTGIGKEEEEDDEDDDDDVDDHCDA
jgi:hypothetical protein